MVDILITKSAVKRSDYNSTVISGVSGEAIIAGCAVYQHTDGKYYKADATTAAKANVVGIALSTAERADAPISIITKGKLTLDGVAKSIPYFLSNTAGGGALCPIADVGAGEYITFVCLGISATEVYVNPVALGITN